MSTIELECGDCLHLMRQLPNKSIDMILCDLPYGTTTCKWDKIIPFNQLWEQYNRIIKDKGVICLFGQEPFSSNLRLSNIKYYKYDLYWVKEKPTNFLQLKKRAGKTTENIMIFYKSQCTYNPQKYKVNHKVINKPKQKNNNSTTAALNFKNIQPYEDNGTRYPTDVLYYNKVPNGKALHPTQKPVELLKYLILTYSNENNLVLDNCMRKWFNWSSMCSN